MEEPKIYDYLDYRAFLRDMFKFRKQQMKQFSYRFFARKSGFSSPNFLQLVASGKRNLSNQSIAKIAKGFSLRKKEREFFEYLVCMNQASSHEEKNYYYRKMMTLSGKSNIKRIEKAAYSYFSKWYMPVIREIVMYGDRKQTAGIIAPLLNPSITPAEASNALEILQEMGLIYKEFDGRWNQEHRDLSTGPEVKSLVIANFHREMMRLAAESIERFPATERDLSALVLNVRRDRMPELKQRTAAFRKELLQMAADETEADQVVQVNIHIFPLTRKL